MANMADGGSPLTRILADEIAASGPIPFARYMEVALYHPRYGYYAGGRGGEPLGWAGDYITSGDVHPLWGRMIARQLVQMWDVMERPHPFVVVEPGAGRGLLAAAVWRYALTEAPAFAEALRYTLADRAPAGSPVRALREERLAREVASLALPADALRWVDNPADAFAPRSIIGVVLSNELIDALPVHVVRARGGALEEVYVGLDAQRGRFVEVFGVPTSPAVADYLDRFGIPWRTYPDGWRAEVNLAAEEWTRRVGRLIRRGFVLTIDYGDTARRLYTRDRHLGTLAVYTRHRFGDDPLSEPGARDLTAHVNFTALARAGHATGLRTAGFTSQAAFLTRLGIRTQLPSLPGTQPHASYVNTPGASGHSSGALAYLRAASERAAVQVLLDPQGMGGFRVLLQHRGMAGFGPHLLGFAPPHEPAPRRAPHLR